MRKAITPAFIAMSLLAILSLAGCKGRTLDNVVPTGDTVEVIIIPADDNADSTAAIADTADLSQPEM